MPQTFHFDNLNQFLSDKRFKGYSQGVIFKISENLKDKGYSTMMNEAGGYYNFLIANCGQAVNATLNILNIPIHPDIPTMGFQGIHGWDVEKTIIPNVMYYDLIFATENIARTFIINK